MFTAFKEFSAFGSQWLESSFSTKLNKDSANYSELKSARPFSMTHMITQAKNYISQTFIRLKFIKCTAAIYYCSNTLNKAVLTTASWRQT